MKKCLVVVYGAVGGGEVESDLRGRFFDGGAVADLAKVCRTGAGLSDLGFKLICSNSICPTKTNNFATNNDVSCSSVEVFSSSKVLRKLTKSSKIDQKFEYLESFNFKSTPLNRPNVSK